MKKNVLFTVMMGLMMVLTRIFDLTVEDTFVRQKNKIFDICFVLYSLIRIFATETRIVKNYGTESE